MQIIIDSAQSLTQNLKDPIGINLMDLLNISIDQVPEMAAELQRSGSKADFQMNSIKTRAERYASAVILNKLLAQLESKDELLWRVKYKFPIELSAFESFSESGGITYAHFKTVEGAKYSEKAERFLGITDVLVTRLKNRVCP